jgi:hypothetical protein
LLEVIITSSNALLKDFESNMTEGIGNLGILTRETAETKLIVKQTAGFEIFTPELLAKKSDQ